MKVTLDLTKLVETGKLTSAEADRLHALGAHETGALGINILIGFGVIAVAAGAIALVPTPFTAIAIGVVMFAVGFALTLKKSEQWDLLANICVVIGALMFAGGILAYNNGSLASMMIVTAVFAGAAILARSSLLMAGAVLALASCFGAKAGYWHATYALAIYEPTVTIVVFSAIAFLAYRLSHNLRSDYERIAISASRTSVFLVNFGFWIGSLWGDRMFLIRSLVYNQPIVGSNIGAGLSVPAWVFIVGWAAALLAIAVWGVRANRRWVVNVAAVFGAIHFYTQWFEKLGPSPMTFFIGGVLMLVFALGLWQFNRRTAEARG